MTLATTALAVLLAASLSGHYKRSFVPQANRYLFPHQNSCLTASRLGENISFGVKYLCKVLPSEFVLVSRPTSANGGVGLKRVSTNPESVLVTRKSRFVSYVTSSMTFAASLRAAVPEVVRILARCFDRYKTQVISSRLMGSVGGLRVHECCIG